MTNGTFLEIQDGPQRRRVPFAKDKLTIGRGPDNDIVLADDLASRAHASIEHGSGKYFVRDLNSRNGTRHNGQRIANLTELDGGDKIQIGRHTILLIVDTPPKVEFKDEIDVVEELEDDVLTEEDLVEVEEEEGAGPSDDVLPANLFVDDASVQVQLATLAQNLPNHNFEARQIELTDAAGFSVHGNAARKNASAPGEAVELLRALLLVCVRSRATDIHIEPRQDGHHIRLRIDGMMVDIANIPTQIGLKLTTVVKVLCQIDIAQRKAIQEGAFAARVPDEKAKGKFHRIDYRVSLAPAVLGQKLVIRILDAGNAPERIMSLGLPKTMMDQVAKLLLRDAGMILVAGPTGSGKTTTLYAMLRSIDLAKRNVVTIEDPVEVHLDGITQIPVDESQDRSFIQLLRSVLRQDPDVILVGEIRDSETARVAMQAAITGHMVFSTVHTRDTLGTVFRLRDLAVEPYMLSQGLQLVIAQRLVRQLCPFCKKPVAPTAEQLSALGAGNANVKKIYKPVGCARCLQTGHSGRRAYFELLANNEALAEAITTNASRRDMVKALNSSNFISLRESAYQLVADGLVAFEEVEHSIGTDS